MYSSVLTAVAVRSWELRPGIVEENRVSEMSVTMMMRENFTN
jgi:hypothetical protein